MVEWETLKERADLDEMDRIAEEQEAALCRGLAEHEHYIDLHRKGKAEKRVELAALELLREKLCELRENVCPDCDGTGRGVDWERMGPDGSEGKVEIKCPRCDGGGML